MIGYIKIWAIRALSLERSTGHTCGKKELLRRVTTKMSGEFVKVRESERGKGMTRAAAKMLNEPSVN